MGDDASVVNASYRFQSRRKGVVEIELFNGYYLCLKERILNNRRKFKIEVATLNPQARKKFSFSYHWLALAIISAAVAGYLATATGPMFSPYEIPLAATISAAFLFLFVYTAERSWVVETRNSLYPLVVIPYNSKQQKEAKGFINELQEAIEKNVAEKGYRNTDLFAGEMRMLRRLANNGVLSDKLYNKAKSHMMKNHGAADSA